MSQGQAAAVCQVGVHGRSWMRGHGWSFGGYCLANQSVSVEQHLLASVEGFLEVYGRRHYPSPATSESGL